MSTKIKILPVKCGDSFVIQQKDKNNKARNIIVDGGYLKAYNVLEKQIQSITNKQQMVDLWILTHLDADHINGAVKYLREQYAKGKGKSLGKLWFNFFNGFVLNDDSSFLSFGKGFELAELLRKLLIKGRQDIVNNLKPIMFGDAKITILSPDQKTFKNLKKRWKTEFKTFYGVEPPSYISNPALRDTKTIEELAREKDAKEDDEKRGLSNRSSIAFIYEEGCKRLLMLGDAYPSVILTALAAKYSKRKPLKVKYMKLSHHGSKKNYQIELLNIIQCRRFIISADGENQHGIPDKEVLAKIIMHPNRDQSKRIIFYFSHDDTRFRQLFDVDKDAETRLNFRCKFPKVGKVLTVKL